MYIEEAQTAFKRPVREANGKAKVIRSKYS